MIKKILILPLSFFYSLVREVQANSEKVACTAKRQEGTLLIASAGQSSSHSHEKESTGKSFCFFTVSLYT